MAAKKKNKPKTPNKPKTTVPKIDEVVGDVNKLTGAGLEFGKNLANEFIPAGSMQIDAATSPEMKAYLDQVKQYMTGAGNLTGLEQESLDLMRGTLGGYNSPEVQAMREQAMQEINRQYQTQASQLARQQARGGVRGGAATAQMQDLGVGKMQTAGNLERDLLVKNAEEAQRRKEAFNSLIRQTEDARTGRQSIFGNMYGSALSGEEAARTGREMFNKNEGLTRAGVASSGAGMYTGAISGQQAVDLQQQYLKNMQEQMKSYQDIAMKQIQAQQDSYRQSLAGLQV